MKIVYVAGPFRGVNAWEIEQNIRRAEQLGMKVALAGAMPLIPHANTRFFHGTLGDEFWLDGTLELLRRCDAIIMTDDWRRSSGATAEREEAIARHMPVFESNEINLLERWAK